MGDKIKQSRPTRMREALPFERDSTKLWLCTLRSKKDRVNFEVS